MIGKKYYNKISKDNIKYPNINNYINKYIINNIKEFNNQKKIKRNLKQKKNSKSKEKKNNNNSKERNNAEYFEILDDKNKDKINMKKVVDTNEIDIIFYR